MSKMLVQPRTSNRCCDAHRLTGHKDRKIENRVIRRRENRAVRRQIQNGEI